MIHVSTLASNQKTILDIYTAITRQLDLVQHTVEQQLQQRGFLSTPNFLQLQKIYNKFSTGIDIRTLLIIGPKGCGKTTALCMMYKVLKEAGVEVLYVDVAQFDGSQRDLITEINERPHDVLLIDNVQLYDRESGCFYSSQFVIAASSPGGEVHKKISAFGKSRGDGKWMQLFFAPFNLEWSRKLFEFCGIAVEDELVMGEAVCSEERESQSQAARASYFLSTPPSLSRTTPRFQR